MEWTLSSRLSFSSLFPCDKENVNKLFGAAACKLAIEHKRQWTTVADTYRELSKVATKYTVKRIVDCAIVDVIADGNCLFYCLAAPLIGSVKSDKVCVFYSKCHVLYNVYIFRK